MGGSLDDIGKLGPGDETWKGFDPFFVHLNRIHKTAWLEYGLASGGGVSSQLSFETAEGLIRDLHMKLQDKGGQESP